MMMKERVKELELEVFIIKIEKVINQNFIVMENEILYDIFT